MKKSFLFFVAIGIIVLFPGIVTAYEYDLGLELGNITISKDADNLLIGDEARIYASVKNFGSNDAVGVVQFHYGAQPLGEKEVSVRAGGSADDVFIDFVVPENDFNIFAELKMVSPDDENPSNNSSFSQKFIVQRDNDGDGVGDNNDDDDDNDGWNDDYEASQNTDKDKKDTDGDGVNDPSDLYPLDPSKWKDPEPEPVVIPEPEPVAESEPEQIVSPTEKTEEKAKPSFLGSLFTSDEEKEEEKAELVDNFYKSPEVELLDEVNIIAQQVNWNTYYYTFTTNVDGLTEDQLEYTWFFGDGNERVESGNYKYRGTGQYFVTLKVKGPWDNYLFDTVRVKVDFWSVYNYWLWLIVLAIVGVIFLYSYEIRYKKHKNKSIGGGEKRKIKQPRTGGRKKK